MKIVILTRVGGIQGSMKVEVYKDSVQICICCVLEVCETNLGGVGGCIPLIIAV